METVAAHPAGLEDLVPRAGNDQHLAQVGMPLDVLRLLQQIGPHPAGGVAEELRDVEHPDRRGRPEPGRQIDPRDVERGRRGAGDRLEIEDPGGGPSQSEQSPSG